MQLPPPPPPPEAPEGPPPEPAPETHIFRALHVDLRCFERKNAWPQPNGAQTVIDARIQQMEVMEFDEAEGAEDFVEVIGKRKDGDLERGELPLSKVISLEYVWKWADMQALLARFGDEIGPVVERASVADGRLFELEAPWPHPNQGKTRVEAIVAKIVVVRVDTDGKTIQPYVQVYGRPVAGWLDRKIAPSCDIGLHMLLAHEERWKESEYNEYVRAQGAEP